MDLTNYLLSILISLTVGLAGFVGAYKIFDWLTAGVKFKPYWYNKVAGFRAFPGAPRA